jgi:hypothetical protein
VHSSEKCAVHWRCGGLAIQWDEAFEAARPHLTSKTRFEVLLPVAPPRRQV